MKKIYLSEEKKKELEKELEDCKGKIRSEIGQRILKAKELGDLSENADYSMAKDDLASNEHRIIELEDILASAEIIQSGTCSGDKVGVGCKLEVEVDNKEKKEYEIVGQHDSNPIKNMISNESPLGRVLMDRSVGEEVEYELPNGEVRKYKILGIK